MDPGSLKFMKGLVFLGKILKVIKIIGVVVILAVIIWWLSR
jgi:hypothetical protein